MKSGTKLIKDHGNRTSVLIILGAIIFLIALTISAFFVPELRILHVLQALIYVVIIIYSTRNVPWVLGAGVFISVFWNCFNAFITHLIQSGVKQLFLLIRTGHVTRPDTLMVLVGSIGHFILIVACLVAFIKSEPRKDQWAKFFGGGLLAVTYLILIARIAAPR